MSSMSSVEGARGPLEDAPPGGAVGAEPARGLLDRAQHHPGAAVVERVGAIDLRPAPLEAVALELERLQERRADRHRVDRRAEVVHQPGDGQLAAARAAADRVLGLEHGHREPLAARGRPRRPARSGPSRRRSRRSRRAAAGRRSGSSGVRDDLDREVEGLVEPGLAADHVGDVDPALLDQAGRRVVDPVALALDRGPAGTRATTTRTSPSSKWQRS